MADTKYLACAERLASLRNWPGQCQHNIDRVAYSGLYHLVSDGNDRLRCAFCEFTVANWNINDDIWQLHASFVPTCVHLLCTKGLEFVTSILQEEESLAMQNIQRLLDNRNGNIPRRSEDLTIFGINDILLSRQQQSTSCSPSARCAARYRTARGVTLAVPKHRDMANPDRRLVSFDNTAIRRIYPDLLVKAVVAAGFFYAGEGKSVRCYHCGVRFRNLFERNCDVWKAHAEQVTHCIHVILTKGEEFVNEVVANARRSGKRGSDDTGECVGHMSKKANILRISDEEGMKRAQQQNTDQFVTGVTDDTPVKCRRCNRRCDGQSAVGSLCCWVWVCESCCKSSGQCPMCGKT